MVRTSDGGERPADEHHPGPGRRHLRAGPQRDGGRRRSGRAGRLQQLRPAPRLRRGIPFGDGRSRSAAATASPTSGCSTTRSRTSASTRRTTRSPSPTRSTSRRTPASRSPTDRSIRTARAATSRSASPAPTRTSACRTASASSATSSAGTRRSARRSSRCACPIRTRRTPTRTTGSSARRWNSRGTWCSRRTTSATSGATSDASSTTTPCAATCSTAVLNRLNPSFGGINYRAMLARTEYHGLQFQLNKRLSDGFTGQVAYTLGKAMDNGSDVQVGATPVDARDLDLEWGPSDFDVRHRLVVNWLWELPFFRDAGGVTGALLGGWQINGITQLQSGFPFNVITNAPYPTRRLQRGRRQQRSSEPAVVRPRSARQQSGTPTSTACSSRRDFPGRRASAPCRATPIAARATPAPTCRSSRTSVLSSATKLQFRAEVFNVFNRVNLQRPNGNLSQAHLRHARRSRSRPARSSSRSSSSSDERCRWRVRVAVASPPARLRLRTPRRRARVDRSC